MKLQQGAPQRFEKNAPKQVSSANKIFRMKKWSEKAKYSSLAILKTAGVTAHKGSKTSLHKYVAYGSTQAGQPRGSFYTPKVHFIRQRHTMGCSKPLVCPAAFQFP